MIEVVQFFISALHGDTGTPILNFKTRVDPLACVLCHLYSTDSSYSTLIMTVADLLRESIAHSVGDRGSQ